jgi:phospho-2-dehydro-3-deoxyheptonate aldolase
MVTDDILCVLSDNYTTSINKNHHLKRIGINIMIHKDVPVFCKDSITVGWKGLIMDPHLDGSNRIEEGLQMARQFLLDVIHLGIPTATELLDPITPQYISDLICWSAIGARTTESQTHRQMY